MAQVTEADYKTAQQGDAKVRQDFLDAIDFGENCPLKERAEYQEEIKIAPPSISEFGSLTIMKFSLRLLYPDWNIGEQHLYIYRTAFHLPFNNFMSFLLHHEVHHARQNQKKDTRTFVAQMILQTAEFALFENYRLVTTEVPAYLNQVVNQDEFPLASSDLELLTQKKVPKYERKMRQLAEKLGRDWRADLSRVLCPSPFDDVVRERYNLE